LAYHLPPFANLFLAFAHACPKDLPELYPNPVLVVNLAEPLPFSEDLLFIAPEPMPNEKGSYLAVNPLSSNRGRGSKEKPITSTEFKG
jgi:hypothetical protein